MRYYRAVRRGFLVGLCTLGLTGCASTDHASSTPRHDAVAQGAFDKPSPNYQKAALANVELGLGYLSQGQIARAKSKLTHAIELAPSLPEARSGMAYFLEMTGDYKDAEKAQRREAAEEAAALKATRKERPRPRHLGGRPTDAAGSRRTGSTGRTSAAEHTQDCAGGPV